jgi:hypothetical protein
LGCHFTLTKATAVLNKPIGNSRLAVVNVGDDGKISNMTKIGQGICCQ